MTPDYSKAATKAAETLIKYGVDSFPVSPLPILQQMDNVVLTTFSEMTSSSGVRHWDFIHLFGKIQDSVSSIHSENGRTMYVVAYNESLPFTVIRRSLARELGHVVLKHDKTCPENTEEALCFARHFICPRSLIQDVNATGLRVTVDLLANLTGVFENELVKIRHLPGTYVPASLNRFTQMQFMPFVLNAFEYFRDASLSDGSALADFGTYMDNYEE